MPGEMSSASWSRSADLKLSRNGTLDKIECLKLKMSNLIIKSSWLEFFVLDYFTVRVEQKTQ